MRYSRKACGAEASRRSGHTQLVIRRRRIKLSSKEHLQVTEYGSAKVQNQGAVRSVKIATRAFFILFSPDRSRPLCECHRFLSTTFHTTVHTNSDPKRNHRPSDRGTRGPSQGRCGTASRRRARSSALQGVGHGNKLSSSRCVSRGVDRPQTRWRKNVGGSLRRQNTALRRRERFQPDGKRPDGILRRHPER